MLMQTTRMQRVFGLAACAAVLAWAAPAHDVADARSCYRFWAEADGSGSNYRHFVYVENECDYWLQCSIWTDVDPQPPKMLTVGPDSTENAETNGRSEYDDPRAFGTCHRK